jgi:hypothetical protein
VSGTWLALAAAAVAVIAYVLFTGWLIHHPVAGRHAAPRSPFADPCTDDEKAAWLRGMPGDLRARTVPLLTRWRVRVAVLAAVIEDARRPVRRAGYRVPDFMARPGLLETPAARVTWDEPWLSQYDLPLPPLPVTEPGPPPPDGGLEHLAYPWADDTASFRRVIA